MRQTHAAVTLNYYCLTTMMMAVIMLVRGTDLRFDFWA
jgi:hypothetical protein